MQQPFESWPDSTAVPRANTRAKTAAKVSFPSFSMAAMAFALLLLVGAALVASLSMAPAPQRQLAGFSTSLHGRSRNQRRNAELAARSIDGRVVPPNGVFSFNRAVKSWSVDQGYVKALVSYDGELVRAYGGGVCQTSTTLYNAALLAGLPVLERHPHVFVPHYIVPGRDAAVAFPGIDLRFQNPNPWPIRLRAAVRGDRLEVSLWGAGKAPTSVQIKTEMLGVTMPQRLTRVLAGEASGALNAPFVFAQCGHDWLPRGDLSHRVAGPKNAPPAAQRRFLSGHESRCRAFQRLKGVSCP